MARVRLVTLTTRSGRQVKAKRGSRLATPSQLEQQAQQLLTERITEAETETATRKQRGDFRRGELAEREVRKL